MPSIAMTFLISATLASNVGCVLSDGAGLFFHWFDAIQVSGKTARIITAQCADGN